MYEFLFESCILSVWTFVLFISLFHFYLRFYDPFLRSEFGLHVPCRVKITILTILIVTFSLPFVASMHVMVDLFIG
jgi:hypothetical protein